MGASKHVFFIAFLLVTGSTLAQPTNFNTQRNWSMNKKEVIVGLGATNFLGDLGGANQIGTDYSLRDLDFPSTSFGGVLGYRYRWHPFWATSTTLNVGMLHGSDAKTDEVVRNTRNLHFRSPVINLSQRLEVIVLANEKIGRRYNIGGLRGASDHNFQLYIFGGIGVTYYNPKAKYNGAWVALRPLHTEGQGLPGGPKKYIPFTATVPFGFGIRFGVSKMARVGIEVTYVKTFSDYIDDVHGTYYDPAVLASNFGPEAAALSNPAKIPSWFPTGTQRGDEQKDALLYANITFYRNLTYKSYPHRAKRMRIKNNTRTKF